MGESYLRIAFAACVAAIAGGCAASGPLGSEVLTGSISRSTSRVVIYRTSPFGLAVQPDYLINGRRVGQSQPNGFVVCDLPPGRHEISVGNMPVNVNLFGGSDKAIVDLQPGATTYLHAQPQPGLTIGIVTLSQVHESQGRIDTANLHKIDSECKAA